MTNRIKELTSKSTNFSQWYNDLVIKADLADNSVVRGSMIIKPYGYAIWENIQRKLDDLFKSTGHVNAYFPLFIPKSFLSKEASHVEGFAKECAVVTHYRLKNDPNNQQITIDPEAKLKEELIVRPTSETIIWNTYKKWIQSYRDLPILINQWANVVRWEMHPRLFLRTTEFLWQEGHTAHATKEEAIKETLKIINIYANFMEQFMAIPVITGIKPPNEQFAGALNTYCIEALLQDGKAIQAGTSHFLGQNFAKAFNVQFLTKDGKRKYVWSTSWGISTRLIGTLILTHSDNNGLVLPPTVAPIQVVIIPIFKNEKELQAIHEKIESVLNAFKSLDIRVKYDSSNHKKPGWKFAEYELKGIPIRLTIGTRDLKNETIEVVRRDTLTKECVAFHSITTYVKHILEDIQQNIYQKALHFRKKHTFYTNEYKEFKKQLEQGGFVMAHWDGTLATAEQIKEETKATIRCIPIGGNHTPGIDMISNLPSKQRVVFAKAY